MNTEDLSYLLQHPDKIVSPIQTKQLEEVLEEFPYFQAARTLHLKGLKNLNSFKYNNTLKVVAAYTADREVLFDFITSNEFLQHSIADALLEKTTAVVETEVEQKKAMPQTSKKTEPKKTEDTPLPLTQAEADALLDPNLFRARDDKATLSSSRTEQSFNELNIGEPLPFTKKERYSFGEWLQLTAFKPEKKDKNPVKEKELENIDFPLKEGSPKKKKFDLIDRFIADRPKIDPQKDVPKIAIATSVKLDKKELMTETLAKVYLEQKKYKNAIQAYKILSLKYPEKSGFFADRIKAVERLKAEDAQ